MYKKLTKITTVDNKECVACACFGTKMCQLHNGALDCGHCPMFAAILNQLHTFETVVEDTTIENK